MWGSQGHSFIPTKLWGQFDWKLWGLIETNEGWSFSLYPLVYRIMILILFVYSFRCPKSCSIHWHSIIFPCIDMGAVSWKQVSIADRSNSAHQTKQTSFADNWGEFYSHEILSRTNFWRQSQKLVSIWAVRLHQKKDCYICYPCHMNNAIIGRCIFLTPLCRLYTVPHWCVQ